MSESPHPMHMAVDIGFSGAIALFEHGVLTDLWDMPVVLNQNGKTMLDLPSLVALLESPHRIPVYVELVSAMPGQGVTSMFRFGAQAGAIHGILATLRQEMRLITPVQWKRHFGLLKQSKDASRQKALELFPEMDAYFTRKKDHGRADAALIGLAGYQLSQSKEMKWLT